jgi:hypothetical protein
MRVYLRGLPDLKSGRCLFPAFPADALNNQNFICLQKSFRKGNIGNYNLLYTLGLKALPAIKMHMVVVMGMCFAGSANRIPGLKLIIRNAVENTGIQKLLQAAVYRSPVDISFMLGLEVGVRQGISRPEEGA